VSRRKDDKADGTKQSFEAPTGLDLHPKPESSPRISGRVGIIIGATGLLILAGFAYGGYRRSAKAQALARARGLPRALAPAPDADIVKGIPAGNAAVAGRGAAQPPDLEPPGGNARKASDPCIADGQRFRFNPQTGQPCTARAERVVQRTRPNGASSAISREPSPEEKALLAAYQQEQAAMIAPTAIRSSGQSSYANSQYNAASYRGGGNLPTSTGDLTKISQLTRSLAGSGDDSHSGGAAGAERVFLPQAGRDDYNDQNEQNRKEAFLESARRHQMDDYLRSTREAPLSKYEIKAGWEIPAVLEQGLNSDLPGELKALVTVNVYDTATGQYLLIPQGSRLIGRYDSRISYGQSGVQVEWNRIIFPDASSVDLNGMEGLDAQGNAGLRDKVDRHYKRLFGTAALSSLFSAAFALSQRQNQSVLNYPSATQTAAAGASQSLTETGSAITRRNLNVQPTIKVPIGYRFTVRVNRDILFDAPYEPSEAYPQPASEEKRVFERSNLPSN
jgi:type IV secretion system protein TrbI